MTSVCGSREPTAPAEMSHSEHIIDSGGGGGGGDVDNSFHFPPHAGHLLLDRPAENALIPATLPRKDNCPMAGARSGEKTTNPSVASHATLPPEKTVETTRQALSATSAAAPSPEEEQEEQQQEEEEEEQQQQQGKEEREPAYEISRSPLGGVGAFARRRLAAGEQVLREPALFHASAAGGGALYGALERLTPAQRAEYRRLHAHRGPGADPVMDESAAIFRTNRFSVGHPSGSSIFLAAARFNHACRPLDNVGFAYSPADDCLVLTARRDVGRGEELTICYGTHPGALASYYGIRCACHGGATPGDGGLGEAAEGEGGGAAACRWWESPSEGELSGWRRGREARSHAGGGKTLPQL